MRESGQMYLETIYVLSRKKPYVRSVDVAEHLGYSKPSVSRAMSILRKNGHVALDADGYLTLTESGLQIAQTMYTRHTVLTKLLVQLGVDDQTAAEDACRIEHVISEKTFAVVQRYLRDSNAYPENEEPPFSK